MTMTTIDIAYFPHIFDFAEAEALLLLRLTCRRLRKRVDNEWRHLKWFVPWRKPVEVFNERGVKMSSDSPCLRLTKVLDISCEDGLADGPPFPDHLRPQIIRFLDVAFTPITSHAKTIIFLVDDCGDIGSDCTDLPDLGLEPVNLIYKLNYRPPTDNLRQRWGFEDIGHLPWSADLYILLSGCPPVDGCVRDLCSAIAMTLTGSYAAYDMLPDTDKVNFYLVDVPSWFDVSGTTLPENDPRRLDQLLTRPDTFYGHLLKEAGFGIAVDQDVEWQYHSRWPSQEALERVFKQVHCISREQMRRRVGDEAYDLTFAPRDICAASSSVRLDVRRSGASPSHSDFSPFSAVAQRADRADAPPLIVSSVSVTRLRHDSNY